MSAGLRPSPERNLPISNSRAESLRSQTWVAWAISIVCHLLFVFSAAQLSTAVSKGLTTERSLDVGLSIGDGEDGGGGGGGANNQLSVPEKSATQFDAPSSPSAVEIPKDGPETDLLPKIDVSTLSQPANLAGSRSETGRSGGGSGSGEGGGTGSGIGTGTGFGNGPGKGGSRTRFFGAEAVGRSFVFVIDRSASMSSLDALEIARREAMKAISQLNEQSRFQVIVYNTDAREMPTPNRAMVFANKKNIMMAEDFLRNTEPNGGTTHKTALEKAFSMRPEVIYFLTDADDLSNAEVQLLTAENRKSSSPATIYTVEFAGGPEVIKDHPLRRLALENMGTYKRVDTTTFGPVRQRTK